MNAPAPCLIHNGEPVALSRVPRLSWADFRETVLQACEREGRVAALFGQPLSDDTLRLWAVLAHDDTGQLQLGYTEVGDA